MPAKFVDHTHATAVLSLIDQPDARRAVRGGLSAAALGFVPYLHAGLRPGEKSRRGVRPKSKGRRADPRQARHLHLRRRRARGLRAHDRDGHAAPRSGCRKTARPCSRARKLPQQVAPAIDVAPILRGACALRDAGGEGAHRRLILEFRTSDAILNFVNGKELARYARAGVITPDHAIRTKNWPLIVPAPEAGKLDDFKQRRAAGRAEIHRRLQGLFRAQQRARRRRQAMLDPLPRVVLVPGLGLFGLGRQRQGRAHRRRYRGSRGRGHHRRRGDRPLHVDLAKPTCSTANIGRSNRPSSARARSSRSPARSRSSPAPAAPSARRPRRAFAAAGAEVALLDRRCRSRAGTGQGDRRQRHRDRMRRDRCGLGARRLRSGGRRLRRRRYRGVECRRRLAGPDRRGRRGDLARELRAEFLRAIRTWRRPR